MSQNSLSYYAPRHKAHLKTETSVLSCLELSSLVSATQQGLVRKLWKPKRPTASTNMSQLLLSCRLCARS